MKLKGNWIVWLLAGFLAIALGNKFLRGGGTKNTPSGNTPPIAEEVAPASSSELGYLFSTGDWAHTVPGKAIEGWLGQGTANWVLWSAIVVFVLFFVRDFVSKDKKTGNILNVLYFCAAAVIVAMIFGGTLQTYGKLKEVPIISEIDFRRAPDGHTAVTQMTLNTVVVVRLRMGHVSTGANWACPKVIKPVSLPFTPEFEVVAGKWTNQNHFKLTEQSQKMLLENGTMNVTALLVHTTSHQNPCLTVRY